MEPFVCESNIEAAFQYFLLLDIFFTSFALNPAHRRVCRGNLVVRHSVPHFPPSSGGIACCWRNSTLRLASTPERGNENINVNKYFHFLEWGSNPQPVAFTVKIVLLPHDSPLIIKSVNDNCNFILLK